MNDLFTYKQWEVYGLLFAGYNYREIAKKLYIAHGTVAGHACLMRQAAQVKTDVEMIALVGKVPLWLTNYQCKGRPHSIGV